jgi:hypothetical protein
LADVVYKSANILIFAFVFGGDPPQRIPGANLDLGVSRRFYGANGFFGKGKAGQKCYYGYDQQEARKPAL